MDWPLAGWKIYLTQQGGSNEDLGGSSDTQIWKANLPAWAKVTLTKIGTGLGPRNIAIDTHAMDIDPTGLCTSLIYQAIFYS